MGILRGRVTGPTRDIVLLNSGAGIYIAGGGNSIRDGLEVARNSIDSGKAYRKLRELVEQTGKVEVLDKLEGTSPEEITL